MGGNGRQEGATVPAERSNSPKAVGKFSQEIPPARILCSGFRARKNPPKSLCPDLQALGSTLGAILPFS